MLANCYRALLLSALFPLFPWQSGEYLRETVQNWPRLSSEEQVRFLQLSAQMGGDAFSDYWLVKSTLFPWQQAVEKMAALGQALKLNQWLELRPESAAEELVRLLFRYQQYPQLWQLYLSWSAEWRHFGQTGVYAARALLEMGRTNEAVALARQGLRRNPSHLDYFRVLVAEGWTGRLYRQLARSLDSLRPADPRVLRALIERTDDPGWRQALLHLYGQYWPDDAYLMLTLAELHPTELGKRLRFIQDNYRADDFLVALRWYQRSTGYLPDTTRRAWLTGWFVLDRNYDGVEEEKLLFDAGELRQRNIFFYNAQNWYLKMFFFPGGELESMVLTGRKDGASWSQRINYYHYPMVKTLEMRDGEQRVVYHFDPVRFTLPLVDRPLVERDDWSQLNPKLPSISLDALNKNSYRIEMFRRQHEADLLTKVVSVSADGQPAEVREDADLDGYFEQVTVPYEWQGNATWMGFARRRDHDKDGFFETKELYLQGKPLLYMVDLDKDLTADYTETPAKGGSRTWSND